MQFQTVSLVQVLHYTPPPPHTHTHTQLSPCTRTLPGRACQPWSWPCSRPSDCTSSSGAPWQTQPSPWELKEQHTQESFPAAIKSGICLWGGGGECMCTIECECLWERVCERVCVCATEGVCLWLRKRQRETDRVRARERASERECMCVCVCTTEGMCLWLRKTDRVREWENEKERETESYCVCVCMHGGWGVNAWKRQE